MTETTTSRRVTTIEIDAGSKFSLIELNSSILGLGLKVDDRYIETYLDDFDLEELISKLKSKRRHVKGSRLIKRKQQVTNLREDYFRAKAEADRLKEQVLELDKVVHNLFEALDKKEDKKGGD